jgi:hypothetical protein
VTEEIAGEVGRGRLPVNGPVPVPGSLPAAATALPAEAQARLAQLEQEVAKLRRQVQRDSRLLRQALLMQLGLGDDEQF